MTDTRSFSGTTGLLPCPFCGGPATLGGFPSGVIGQVVCRNDDCFGPRTTAVTKRDSIAQWNKRSGDAAQRPIDSGGPVTGEQEPVGWQWHVGENCWTQCDRPSDEELRTKPDNFRPVYLGRMISAPASHDFRNSGESDLSVTPDCAGAGTAQPQPEPAMWVCLVTPKGEHEEPHIRAWTTSAERAKRFAQLEGLEMRPLYASPMPSTQERTVDSRTDREGGWNAERGLSIPSTEGK